MARLLSCFAVLGIALPVVAQTSDALNEATEQALRTAAITVAPSVVLIETTGGTETVGAGQRAIRQLFQVLLDVTGKLPPLVLNACAILSIALLGGSSAMK